ncbi:MAG: SDR family NAD(P)-dependent oxidoreductase, partial [Clostridia bacterium]
MSKTVFITGGSGGIGGAMVHEFANAGYNVAFTYKNNRSGAEALTEGFAIYCDVSDGESVNAAINEANERFGKIDVLINNAGIARQKLFTDITEDEWDEMMNVNLKSCFLTCKAVLPQMISRKSGVIINVSSMWGICGASCEVHYSAAKSGVIGLTKALAKEVGLSGIRVNCIAPGVIDTPMNSNLSSDD